MLERKITLCGLIGHKGAGKTAILEELLKFPEFKVLMTYTNRPRRNGESNIETRFISWLDYKTLTSIHKKLYPKYEKGSVLQESSYRGYKYCTIHEGYDPDFIYARPILWDGILGLEETNLFDIKSILIEIPSVDEYKRRILFRSDYHDLKRSIEDVNIEEPPPCPSGREYDYVIVNNNVKKAAKAIRDLMTRREKSEENISKN